MWRLLRVASAAWLALSIGSSPTRADDAEAWLDAAIRLDLAGDGSAAAAFAWYLRAAEAGLPEAEFDVAVMLDSGRGVGKDVASAATWYARAAAHDNHRAAYNLGQLYEAGEGVPKNPDLARTWFAASDVAAARAHLAALDADPSVTPSAGSLTAPDLVAPQAGAEVEASPRAVEFVWTSRVQPEPTDFFVEIRELGQRDSREVFSGFTRTSSLAAPLSGSRGSYAWRVVALARRAGQYAASPWSRFDARSVDPAPVSTATPPARLPDVEAARQTVLDRR